MLTEKNPLGYWSTMNVSLSLEATLRKWSPEHFNTPMPETKRKRWRNSRAEPARRGPARAATRCRANNTSTLPSSDRSEASTACRDALFPTRGRVCSQHWLRSMGELALVGCYVPLIESICTDREGQNAKLIRGRTQRQPSTPRPGSTSTQPPSTRVGWWRRCGGWRSHLCDTSPDWATRSERYRAGSAPWISHRARPIGSRADAMVFAHRRCVAVW